MSDYLTPMRNALAQWASRNFRSLAEALRWLHAHRAKTVEDKPLFSDVSEALYWAYRTRPRIVRLPPMVRLMGKSRRAADIEEIQGAPPARGIDPELDDRPYGLDAVAQIGMIKEFVNRLPDRERCYLIARYAQDVERRTAREDLVGLLMPVLSAALRPPRVVYQLVCRYYGRRVSFHKLAARMVDLYPDVAEPRRQKHVYRIVRKMYGEIDRALGDIGGRADETAYLYFHERGVIK